MILKNFRREIFSLIDFLFTRHEKFIILIFMTQTEKLSVTKMLEQFDVAASKGLITYKKWEPESPHNTVTVYVKFESIVLFNSKQRLINHLSNTYKIVSANMNLAHDLLYIFYYNEQQ